MITDLFDQEVMLCIEEVELLRPGKWHDINICPTCNCQAPIDSLSSLAASFIIRQSNSGKRWASNVPALLHHAMDEVIRQQHQQPEPNMLEQRHPYLQVMYREFLDRLPKRDLRQDTLTGHGHELLPGIHPSDSLIVHEDSMPESNITVCQIFLGQLEPVRDFIRSRDNPHLSSANSRDKVFRILLSAAVKTGQYDLTRHILDQGADIDSTHYDLAVAFERQDLTMMKLLLDPNYKHTRSEGPRRIAIEDLIVRSTQLDLRDITNILLDHAEYMNIGFIHTVLSNACCNGDDDLVQRLFNLHRHLDVNMFLGSVEWMPELHGLTPLMPVEIAAIRGHESILRLLLKNDVETYTRHARLVCMMDAAALGGHVGIIRILLEAGVDPSPAEWRDIIRTYMDARRRGVRDGGFIRFLLEENLVDISMYLRLYPQTLYLVFCTLCCAGDVAAVRLFAAHGMPLFGGFYSGIRCWTPMDVATDSGSQELIEALEELGRLGPQSQPKVS
ncbi:hypothetical protein PG994_002569 [Apiospora phragmitis]|uniref:Ankyrin n=1 Tax=Apiospora phragmitis TaxID=2905665 RepID=A0ABR1W5Q6_9PEZI